jgi:2,3-bisphosphoglycerate-independent phosphoglycerate mutase
MVMESVSPLVLVILDGWGYREETDGNAIAAANTPVMDSLWHAYPKTLIQASGKDVGLPKGQMGNSEVGHLNIGAGRVVPQELVRISDAVEDRTLYANSALVGICESVKANGKLHLMGLCSDGGVHSHIDHLIALVDLAKTRGVKDICIHVITDGRDTPPTSGIGHIGRLQNYLDLVRVGRIVTISGRYYAMDRDRRWDRVQKAYEVMTNNEITADMSASEVLLETYAQDITDEFILPVRIAEGAIEPGDGIICFNFRPDRSREITQALLTSDFNGFTRPRHITPLHMATFTQYDPSLPVDVAFPPQSMDNMLGNVIAKHGLQQFRAAETEKYAHVTYFFDGGQEEPNVGDERVLVNSPMVPTYDDEPEMSASLVTDAAIAAVNKHIYSLIVMNYANPDMVGHTGNFEATVEAIEHVDRCLGKLVDSVNKAGGTLLITADHGNAEYMWDEDRNPWTAHTTNPVPFILVEGEGLKIHGHGGDVKLRDRGRLSDIAPTILDILQIPKPEEMTGSSLLETADYEVQRHRTPANTRL